MIRGLVPQPGYDIEASVPGFTSQHLDGGAVHGMEPITLPDLIVSRSAPGSLSGIVRNQAGSPVPGAVVSARLTTAEGYLGQVDFAASTNAQGQYRFGDLPTGSYTLRIDPEYCGRVAMAAPSRRRLRPVSRRRGTRCCRRSR